MQSISPAAGQVAALPDDQVVRVRGLVKRYGDLVAVDGIDFDVARGEVFALLGPNGAGKTTTVEILEGLRAPDAGTATVLGVDVATGADRIKPRIGVSLQTAALYPKLTVTELIDLFGSFYPKARPANELIDLL
jgi:ABC-2 type transport system ATP-binding protein